MKIKISISFALSILTSWSLCGQGFEVPVITQDYSEIQQKKSPQSRNENDAALSLPFWDDFSQSRVFPDTLKWENSYDVAISPTDGVNNMSFNVAVFNGINAAGSPHSTVELQSGDTDILTSCTIDLSDKGVNDDVYLSFFYEKKGNGELPNNDDGIRVEFMDEDSLWVTNIWSVIGEDVLEVDSFYQVLIHLNDESYFSDKFRFRIVATGRQTGLFDTWLIDYVYLNESRSASDRLVSDRTFTQIISSPFKDFRAIPIQHFLTGPNFMMDFMGSQYVQLGNTTGVQLYELNATIEYINEDETIGTTPIQQLATDIDTNFDFNGDQSPFYRRDFEVETLLDVSDIPSTVIYAEVQAELLGSEWDDGMLDIFDLNINDTLRSTFVLNNYYAYDDGTAERGAGVNITGNQIAYEFGLTEVNADEISAIDIYFPKTIDNVQFGKQVKLKIFSQQNGLPGNELYSKDILIQKNDTLNQYYRYELNELIAVSDTFYIGWEQLISDRIYVGLDKNTDSKEHIFFNTTGEWEQNINDIVGSLMIRPIFGELEEEGTVTATLQDTFDRSIKLYPNPTTGVFRIVGEYEDLEIYDLSGRKIKFDHLLESTYTEISVLDVPKGMYLVRINKGSLITTKIIIMNQ